MRSETTAISEVAVIGAGYMGGGIAQSLAAAGVRVRISDATVELAAAGVDRVLADCGRDEADGLLPEGTAATVAANLRPAASLEEAVEGADLVEEVVPEVLAVKREVLARISAVVPAATIIASNTSTIPLREMVGSVTHPERFLLVHWSNPAHLVPGIELIVGDRTDPDVVERVEALLAAAGRVSAVIGDSPGFVLNRLQFALVREALMIVDEGHASPEAVDTVLRTTLGFRMPFIAPIAMLDMAGLDTYAKGFGILEDAFGPRFSAPAVLTEAVAAGRHGMKNGRGIWRDYPPETLAEISAWRAKAYTAMSRLLAEVGPAPVPPVYGVAVPGDVAPVDGVPADDTPRTTPEGEQP